MRFRNSFLILTLLVLACVLRLAFLGSMPDGFNSDEASLGYNAYSILKTGRDEYGVKFPLAFKSFGEYKAPLYIYLTVPSIFCLGLTEFAVRLPSAIFGALTVVVVFYLADLIFKNKKIAYISAVFLSILPWHLQFSRLAYEGSLALLVLTLATFFFISGLKKKVSLFFSAFLFAVSFYTHYSIRFFVPLYLLSLLIIYREDLIKIKKDVFKAAVIGLITIGPLLPFLFSASGLSRASYISFLTDSGLVFSINEKRAEHNWSTNKFFIPEKLLHNKIIEYPKKFLENYVSHFDPSFLLIKGDEDKLYKTPFTGLVLYSLFPFFLVGIISLFRKPGKNVKLLLAWFFLSPISSSLTRLGPSANRAFIMVVPFSIICGVGFAKCLGYFKKQQQLLFVILWGVFFVVEYILYLDSYYIHQNIKNFEDQRFVSKEVVNFVKSESDNYDTIFITNKLGSYIHFLFYLQYPPQLYQKQARLDDLNEYGFGTVTGFGKYKFERIPKYFDLSKNILYVVQSGEEPKDIDPLYKTYYFDGRVRYIIFDTQSVRISSPGSSLELKPPGLDIFGDMIKGNE